jgi:hypothetical protein
VTAAPAGVTLRELDERLGRPKGTAFRAFKRAGLVEGRDFRVLTPGADAAAIAQLRAAGRIYAVSVNVILLTADAAERLAAILRG